MKTRVSCAAGRKLTCLAVLLAIVLSAGASAAPYPKVPSWGPIQLENVGDEPQASGVATLTNLRQIDEWSYDDGVWVAFGREYTGQLSITCDSLTPGATYSTPAGTLQPGRRTGTGKVKGTVTFWITGEGWSGWGGVHISPFLVTVNRLNPDGSSTTVLEGAFPPGY